MIKKSPYLEGKPRRVLHIFCGSQRASNLALNDDHQPRVTHIELLQHFMKKKVLTKILDLLYLPMKPMAKVLDLHKVSEFIAFIQDLHK